MSEHTLSSFDAMHQSGSASNTVYWKTLRHAGVLFPPDYEPHGVPVLYEGKPVKLSPQQEEGATMYAAMHDSDYLKKKVFRKNFWSCWKELLGSKHTIKSLDKCDFSLITNHLNVMKENKKNIGKEEKKAIKEKKDAAEAIYKVAYVNGKPEPVGNFRVEPPGLFRGRGEHPKMGMIKARIYPKDVTINIGKKETIPQHPYKGMKWKEVIHDPTVTWLAKWTDTINPKDVKYVFLAPTSTVKADSDQNKYEVARKLAKMIKRVRRNYESDLSSKSSTTRQVATAIYLIDRLALRAGHEKGEDEADTVGTCTLKAENVDLVAPSFVKLNFLGKDSIRYENTVEVDKRVFKNIGIFKKDKEPGDLLFHRLDATMLNKELKKIMPELSAKVFRTYNASFTLDTLLNDEKHDGIANKDVTAKKAVYERANKEVAVLCNHQRAVPNGHAAQVQKIKDKIKDLKSQTPLTDKQKERLGKLKLQLKMKNELKQVALGTSKINYLDPRITIAWCKRNEMPIEKIFTKTLLNKFVWAMDESMRFRF